MDELKQTGGFMQQAAHWFPFLALMVKDAPPNRPMLTRIIEQSTVGLLAAALALYVDNERQNDTLVVMGRDMTTMATTISSTTIRLEAQIDKLDRKIDDLQKEVYKGRK